MNSLVSFHLKKILKDKIILGAIIILIISSIFITLSWFTTNLDIYIPPK